MPRWKIRAYGVTAAVQPKPGGMFASSVSVIVDPEATTLFAGGIHPSFQRPLTIASTEWFVVAAGGSNAIVSAAAKEAAKSSERRTTEEVRNRISRWIQSCSWALLS